MLNNGYLALEVINGTKLPVPSERMPAGLYVLVSTPYGRWNTAIKTAMADQSVPWNETLIMWARPLMFPRWLMSIFPSKSKIVQIEIRASFEHGCLGRGELLGMVQTTLEELLLHPDIQFRLPYVNAQCPSLLLRTKRVRVPRLVARVPARSGALQSSRFHSIIGHITDRAHEAYTLYRGDDHPKHLDKAIEGFQEALDQSPDDPHRAAALSNLAHAIFCGFTKGVRTDIDHAISLFRSALAHHPQDHPDHPLSILNLCKALHHRHLRRKDRADIREAAELYRSILPLCVEDSHLHFHTIEQCNSLPRDSSDECIMLRRTVVEHCHPRHPHRAPSLNRLAGDLYARFKETGNIDHLHEAIDLSRDALVECPADGDRSFLLSVLSYYILKRFHYNRDAPDIEECISLNREVLTLHPPGHPAHERSLNHLANALKARYDLYGNITDFEEAKQLGLAARDLSSGHSGTLPPLSQHIEVYLGLERSPLTSTPEPDEGQQRQPPLEPLMSDQQTRPRARNIVIFGESGSGKSSVINAITQTQRAETSSSAAGCTFRYQKHEVEISGESFVLFDTVGLDEGTAGTVPAAEAVENLKSLLRELMSPRSNGIGLLVYCVRSVRLSRALLRNYNLFYSAICRKKVPIVVVVTGLENQEPTMDSWWDANETVFKRCGMHFEDHACVTTLRNGSDIPDVFAQRMTESREILRRLILNNCSEWTADESWFKLSFADVRNMISNRWNSGGSPPSTLIICDPSQKEVQIAHGIYGVVETCFLRIGGVKYQVHIVPEPESPVPTSSIEADLLIYHARANEGPAARRKFNTFCSAYRGSMIPVIVVVQGLNDSKAAQDWVERYLAQNGGGRPFSTFVPTGHVRDRIAEQELQELIQQSCLIRSEGKGDGIHKSIMNFFR